MHAQVDIWTNPLVMLTLLQFFFCDLRCFLHMPGSSGLDRVTCLEEDVVNPSSLLTHVLKCCVDIYPILAWPINQEVIRSF